MATNITWETGPRQRPDPPPRLTNLQASILWCLRHDPGCSLVDGSDGCLHWNGWSNGRLTPWGEPPRTIPPVTSRSLLTRKLLRPVCSIRDRLRTSETASANVHPVDFSRRNARPAADLAKFIFELSQKIGGERIAYPAHAALIVLTGPHGNEVVHDGHRSGKELQAACAAAGAYYYAGNGNFGFLGDGMPSLTLSLEGRAALLHREEQDAIRRAEEDLDPHVATEEQRRIRNRMKLLWDELDTEWEQERNR